MTENQLEIMKAEIALLKLEIAELKALIRANSNRSGMIGPVQKYEPPPYWLNPDFKMQVTC